MRIKAPNRIQMSSMCADENKNCPSSYGEPSGLSPLHIKGRLGDFKLGPSHNSWYMLLSEVSSISCIVEVSAIL